MTPALVDLLQLSTGQGTFFSLVFSLFFSQQICVKLQKSTLGRQKEPIIKLNVPNLLRTINHSVLTEIKLNWKLTAAHKHGSHEGKAAISKKLHTFFFLFQGISCQILL